MGPADLDLDTLRALESLATCWRVSKPEALRRAIHDAAARAERIAGEVIEL